MGDRRRSPSRKHFKRRMVPKGVFCLFFIVACATLTTSQSYGQKPITYPTTTTYKGGYQYTTKYPPTKYPSTTKYTPTKYPTTKYPTTKYTPTKYPPTKYPPTKYPPTKYPPTHQRNIHLHIQPTHQQSIHQPIQPTNQPSTHLHIQPTHQHIQPIHQQSTHKPTQPTHQRSTHQQHLIMEDIKSHFVNASTPSLDIPMLTGETRRPCVGPRVQVCAMLTATLTVATSSLLPVHQGASLPLPVTSKRVQSGSEVESCPRSGIIKYNHPEA